jgi:hypothetical protein
MKGRSGVRSEARAEPRGPNPGVVATAFTVLFIAALIPVTLIVSETHFPAPIQPPEDMVAYFQAEAAKVRICAFLQFCSAIPLGIFTTAMVSRLRLHGAQSAWVLVALFGGLAASSAVALSALIQWTISQPGIAGDSALLSAASDRNGLCSLPTRWRCVVRSRLRSGELSTLDRSWRPGRRATKPALFGVGLGSRANGHNLFGRLCLPASFE